jgi:SAM-dependent methyltransferase
LDTSLIGKCQTIVVELGSGDGRLLSKLASNSFKDSVFFIGIEIDSAEHQRARKQVSNNNILFINESVEKVVADFPDESVDTFISVLPHPKYIDQCLLNIWLPFYRIVLKKLKKLGHFILVTELTDDLFQPVSNSVFTGWKQWLQMIFSSIGFKIKLLDDGAPPDFSSRYLDQFTADPERIRLVTMILTKVNHKQILDLVKPYNNY